MQNQMTLSTQNLKEISMIFDQVKKNQEEHLFISSPPPPYMKEQEIKEEEVLPTYNELTNELEQIMNKIPSRLEDQRSMISTKVQKRRNSSQINNRRSSIQLNQLLDKMEKYRHQDQDFISDNKLMMNQLKKNMYTIQSTSNSNHHSKNKSSINFSSFKNLKYPFFTKKMKSRRSSSPNTSSNDDLDLFLNSVYVSTKQSQLLDQRAIIMAA